MKKLIISFSIAIFSLFTTAQMGIPPVGFNPANIEKLKAKQDINQ